MALRLEPRARQRRAVRHRRGRRQAHARRGPGLRRRAPAAFRHRAVRESHGNRQPGFRQRARLPDRCGERPPETVRCARVGAVAGVHEILSAGRVTSMAPLSRRALLRGIGMTMALPWLESVDVWAAAPTAFPRRFAVLFMGNGISGNHWWAAGAGDAMRLGPSLAPLESLKQKIVVVNGLFSAPSVGKGIHPAQTGNLLSGATLQCGPTARAGITVDQVLAARVGRETALPSLVLACDEPAAGCEMNVSLAYSSHVSWRRAGSPAPADV